MPPRLLLFAALLLLLDAALRLWRPLRERAKHNLVYLAVAWAPFFALPHLQPRAATVVAAVAALLSLFDFARMVGLTVHLRFFLPALAAAGACFPLAAARLEGGLGALPVLALLVVLAAGVVGKDASAFLQKLSLAWISVLVYGYLYAHAALLVATPRLGLAGPALLACIILLAKCADVAWVLVRRLRPAERLQLLASPVGGLAGGVAVAALLPAAPVRMSCLLGLGVGVGLGVGSRAFNLVVADVTGQSERQRKGTMLYGFGLALALGYWILTLAPRSWS